MVSQTILISLEDKEIIMNGVRDIEKIEKDIELVKHKDKEDDDNHSDDELFDSADLLSGLEDERV